MFDYWGFVQKDIIEYMMAGFNAKDCYIRDDHKIALPTRPAYTTPWVHTEVNSVRNCGRYQMIYHGAFNFIHTRCMNCWKVVLRPRNLPELFEVLAYQKELRRPSKCGIEIRAFVHGNYGAYWYTASMEEGLDLKDTIHKDFPKLPIILKKGCTEFEMAHGPSDRWEHTALTKELEELLDEMLVEVNWDHTPYTNKKSPHYVDGHAKRRWIEFAYDRGDSTYKLYTKGHIITAPIVTYDRELQNGCQVDKLIEIVKR